MNNTEFFMSLRNDERILEKKYGNISSFNFFRRHTGYKTEWSEDVKVARGLYFNNETHEIVARSHPKFWAIDAEEHTKMEVLKQTLKFPVNCYLKENGFLGILGYDSQIHKEVFCTKACVENNLALDFRRVCEYETDMKFVRHYLESDNATLIFEVILPEVHPHVIEYDREQVILLDIVYRESEYRKAEYQAVRWLAGKLGIKHKVRTHVLNNWEEFEQWYNEVNQEDYLYEGKHIEGFVTEDQNGYMTKVKLPYYLFWKKMRKVRDYCRKDSKKEQVDSLLLIPNADKFHAWLMSKDPSYIKKSIIELRKMFYEETNINGGIQ